MDLISIGQAADRLGLPLDTAGAVLAASGPQWRELVRQQIAELDQVIAQAQAVLGPRAELPD